MLQQFLRSTAIGAAAAVSAAAMLCLAYAKPVDAQAARTNPALDPVSLGVAPFRLGMTLDEIRAAAPEIAWRNVMVSRYSGRVFSMRSDDTIAIAGVDFQVSVLAHYYEHGLRLEGVNEVADAAACERVGLDVLTAIEPQAGPFESHAPVITAPTGSTLAWQTQRSASGSITVVPVPGYGSPGRTDGETVKFGNGSTVLVEAFDDQYRPRARTKLLGFAPAFLKMQAFNRADHHSVEAEVSYGKDSDLNCAVRIELRQWTPPPLPLTFDTSKAKIVDQPSIAERHVLHARLANETGPAFDAELACGIDRQSGWTFQCGVVLPDGISPAQEEVALNLARITAFDVTGVDRDDPQMMRGTVRVRVDPADRKPIDFAGEPRTPLEEVEFVLEPTPDDTKLLFPHPGGAEGAQAEVRLACRIVADGSLICMDAEGAADPERKAIVATAIRVAASEYRVAPALRSGAPSAGRVIDLNVRAQLQF